MKRTASSRTTRHLSVLPSANAASAARLTRAHVAARLGVSISTVRRYEGVRLHPHVDEDETRWFDEPEVAALAAELANEPRARLRNASAERVGTCSSGELAALVFERLEQRQSLAEIVVGLRLEPQAVRALFDQWCLGLTEGQLRMAREPHVPRENEIARASVEALEARLAALPPAKTTRISVGRLRGPFRHDDADFAWVVELGGFHVSGPCTLDEISRRFGPGDYRVTTYGFDPPGLRWELLVEGIPPA